MSRTRKRSRPAPEPPPLLPGGLFDKLSPHAGYVAATIVSAGFVALVLSKLATVPHDYDEAWLILDARAISRGARPFVDFPHHEMPLHLYLLALAGRLFGQTLVGYRLLSVASLAGSGFVLFCFLRPLAGVLPGLVAQVAFLFSPAVISALPAVPETPMLFFSLLGAALLFVGTTRWSAVASAVAFVLALFIKPTCLLMVVAAAVSLVLGRAWRRLVELSVSGLLASALGLGLWVYLSHGIFAELLQFQLTRIMTGRTGGMWTIESGFTDMRKLMGVATPFQLAFSTLQTFFQLDVSWVPMGLFVLSLLALPIWVGWGFRKQPTMRAFTVLWPAAYFFLNFVALDFVSPRYFVSFLGFSSFLVAGWFWLAQRWLPTPAISAVGAVVGIALVSQFASAIQNQSDPWYWARNDWIAHQYPRVVSFTPIRFVLTGTDPGCDLANPALTYGGFGEVFLVTEHARPFRFSDERLISCLKTHPDIPVIVDWSFYFFTRPGSPLRRYLAEEGSAQRLFFSPEAVEQWDRPVLQMNPFR